MIESKLETPTPVEKKPEFPPDELLHCPFCGSYSITAEARTLDPDKMHTLATCTNNNCKAEMVHKEHDVAVRRWNTRFPWPPPEKPLPPGTKITLEVK